MKKSIREVVVVEGKDDTTTLRRFFEVQTYETGGFALSRADIRRIKRLSELWGVVVFTDPDKTGEEIRARIREAVPEAKHAFLTQKKAAPSSKSKGRSLGIEHAGGDAIAQALALAGCHIDENADNIKAKAKTKTDVTVADLMHFGLSGREDSRQRRAFIGQRLGIGYVSAKQLLSRLSLFAISKEALASAIADYESANK